MIILSCVAFKETHAPTVLHRRAKKLRQDTGGSRYQTAYERLQADRKVVGKLAGCRYPWSYANDSSIYVAVA